LAQALSETQVIALKKKERMIITPVAVGLFLPILVFLTLSFAAPSTANDRPAPVVVATVEQTRFAQEVPLNGSVMARRSTRVAAEVDGRVTEVLVEQGDYVEQGAVLLRLRAIPTQLRLATAKAELQEAEATARLAKISERRLAKLAKSRVVSEDDYDTARAKMDESLAVAAGARAKMDQIRDELTRHTVTAPFDGVITEKIAEVGVWVETGDVLFAFEDIDRVRLEFPTPQSFYSQVSTGTPVEVRLDAMPAHAIKAEVSRKIPVASASARTFMLWVELDNPDHRIIPGMSARGVLRLEASAGPSAFAVSRDALVRKPDGTVLVWVLEQDRAETTVKPIKVVPGRALDGRVEVNGTRLSVGDRIVIKGNETLRRGQAVRVVTKGQ
jgi:RND family efflux transporter MFP subunit